MAPKLFLGAIFIRLFVMKVFHASDSKASFCFIPTGCYDVEKYKKGGNDFGRKTNFSASIQHSTS